MITERASEELLSVLYETSGTSTSTATNGAALSNPFGGAFTTTADRPVFDLKLSLNFLVLSTTGLVEAFVLVDNVVKMKVTHACLSANLDGWAGTREARIDDVAAGPHTIAVNVKVSGGTGQIAGAADSPCWLLVKEAP